MTFNAEKLLVTYRPPATKSMPAEGRKYTLTHSDATGELFLGIGTSYDKGSINPQLRDEFLAEWQPRLGQFLLSGKVYISSGDFDENISRVRYMVFMKEIPTALEAIIHGDRVFFQHFPWLVDSPIYVTFESVFPEFNKIMYYGTPRQYMGGKKKMNV
ncbi:staygreen family protein [Bacillus sp. MUM 13]|uniref:staygreen family protein n=1 Tax=Bacillus sp. MUM 13 TaxID=1678001 RepID=UPI0008F5F06E|nr:staygreen family protein [Bacillus sp. MUM 13]OIK09894.1 hypothetical protein BIV59_15655 [Bacillus sp. MUM 13]